MNIINDMANFRVIGMTPSKFAISQSLLGFMREAGGDYWINISNTLNRNFTENGKIKPFASGIYSLTKEFTDFAYKNPYYIGAVGASAFGIYNLGRLIYKHGAMPKLSTGQRISQGFSKNITDIVNNPLYTIYGCAAAAFIYQKIHENFTPNDKK